jgi:hypothetical protein
MGITAMEVAKEKPDIILMNYSFVSIVKAIMRGCLQVFAVLAVDQHYHGHVHRAHARNGSCC